jgi:hypothetical protein
LKNLLAQLFSLCSRGKQKVLLNEAANNNGQKEGAAE